jgi:ankyrin repeat protein
LNMPAWLAQRGVLTQQQAAATSLPFRGLFNGNCAALKSYIREGGEINAVGAKFPHVSLLHSACRLKVITAAQLLVEAGVTVNIVAEDGTTPLMVAKTADVARLLLVSGADIELTDSKGWNALRRACENGYVELVKLLLKRGSLASITQTAPDGMTPLNVAVRSKNEALAMLVLAAQPADYDDNEGLRYPHVDTNLYAAAGYNFLKVAEALLKRGANPNRGRITAPTRTPYMGAAQEGHLAMLDLLHQYGADVNAVSSDGSTALDSAINNGRAPAVKCMLRHGVDVHATHAAHDAPLKRAITDGHLSVVRVLLDAGVQVPGCSEVTLISDMLRYLDDDAAVPMLKLLLQYWGTDVNTVCDKVPDGGTVIFAAVMHKRLKAACYLVSAGADLSVKTLRGHTLVHIAAQFDAVRMLRWLVGTYKLNPCEAAENGWLPLHSACNMGGLLSVEYLLSLPQAAAMVTAQSDIGYTALHSAANSEHNDIMQLLLRKGAVVDARSHSGVTPLMQAQLLRTVRVLLSAHADVNAVDAHGRTVLHYCARQGAAECVYRLLLQHGAVPTAVDVTGSTPAHIAGMNGHFAVEALLSKAADEYSKTHLNDTLSSAANGTSNSEQQLRGVAHVISSSSSGSSNSSGSGSANSSSGSSGQEASKGTNSETSSSEAAALAGSAAVASSNDSEVVTAVRSRKSRK